MRNLISVPFDRLQKEIFRELTYRTIGIVEKHDYNRFSESYNNLKRLEGEAAKLQTAYRKHPNSDELKMLRKEQDRMVSVILQHKKSVEKMNDATLAVQMKLTSTFVDEFLGNYKKEEAAKKNSKIRRMFATMDKNDALKNALVATWYERSFSLLRPISEGMYNLVTDRSADRSANLNYTESSNAFMELKAAMQNLFAGIELAIRLYPTDDFSLLVKEMNDMLSLYRSPIKQKLTRNKNAALNVETTTDEAEVAPKAATNNSLTADDKNKAA